MKPDTVFSKIQELTEKWFAGELSDKRFAEIVAGLINERKKEK